MDKTNEEKMADQIRVNVILGRGLYKKFRSAIALKGTSMTSWLKGKMAEEIERVNTTQ
jgi:hypothetical protein